MYFDDEVELTKFQMFSIQPQGDVEPNIIKTWASHLNMMEIYKDKISPSRLFITTDACVSKYITIWLL